MIAFAACTADAARFRGCALAGLRLAAEPDSIIVEATADESIFTAYNEVLDALRDWPELEALVLLHEDAEIVDQRFCAKVRSIVADPNVAIAGVVGARGVTSLCWWEGQRRGRVVESRGVLDFGGGRHDVDAVDGLLMALSPWAVRNLRFDDERFSGFHGYDADICFQARAAGKSVVVDDLSVVHHTKGGYGDAAAFRAADAAWREKWTGHPVVGIGPEAGWRLRCPVCWTPVPAPERASSRHIVACGGCGSGVTVPAPEREAEGDAIFEEQYGGARLAQRPQWFAEAALRLEWVEPLLPAGGTIVDVGCATGELPALAAERGLRAVGIEPSPWAAEQARALGVEVAPDLEALRGAAAGIRADVVTLFHVLEHVHDPLEFLRQIRPLLRPGGRLFVEVPNFGARDAAIDPIRWTGTALNDHVLHYTADSLSRLLAAAGYDTVERHTLTYELYDPPELWRARIDAWARAGLREPSEDLLRVVAVPRPGR